jgi:uncharacterized protein YbjT (DUF2867 family)
MSLRDVFVTGGTGYIGRRLISTLAARGHRVTALARAQSATRVPAPAQAVIGDALSADSYAHLIPAGSTFVHLIGTPHPSPAKAAEFERVDRVSIGAAIAAATRARVAHFIYLSVAQPAPVMQAYVAVRAAGEAALRASGLRATALRPWYVLGPGHWWPVLLWPLYQIAALVPSTRDSARRMGLCTISQMVSALVSSVEQPPPDHALRVVDVPAIRAAKLIRELI